jgi:predicted SnoaL-like aldol condensation-catalyzing enzyme
VKANVRTFLAAATLMGFAASSSNNKGKEPNMSNREKVVQLLKSIETGDPGPVAFINPDKYIQHNLAAGDGLAGFGALMQQLPKGSAKVHVVRAFEDGDFVFTHTDYDFFGPKIGFDVFRFEKGLIVEHWDNLQETVAKTPSGHTMIDGPQESSGQGNTAANKALVSAFVDDILIGGKMDKLAGYYDGDNYIQHNPQIPDKVSGLGAALQAMAKQGITLKYTKTHKVLGEGNFVLAMSEGHLGGQLDAFYDLFRVENGKIAEHWDVIQPIPPKTEWKNKNGKF